VVPALRDAARLTEELVAAAQRCRDESGWPPGEVADLESVEVVPDETFCCEVADRFESAPAHAYDDELARRYDRMKAENLRQYEAILDAGIRVEPWLRRGQPYRDAGAMARSVRKTRTIHVFLTRDGHGPGRGRGPHPLREPSGVTASAVPLTHNDLFRVTHDVFGHVMLGNSFGPAGELRAAYCHMTLFSELARPVLFTENVAQTCWFFFGSHLRDEAGRLRRPGDPGYLPPRRRPYPEQKIFAFEPSYLDEFRRMFALEEAA